MKLLRAIGGISLGLLALPFALAGGITFSGRKCTAAEFASELDDLAAGEMNGWDKLESVRIKDARLEAIRQEAMVVNLPLKEEDRALLKRLATKAAATQPNI